jgi:hypothetical protein
MEARRAWVFVRVGHGLFAPALSRKEKFYHQNQDMDRVHNSDLWTLGKEFAASAEIGKGDCTLPSVMPYFSAFSLFFG